MSWSPAYLFRCSRGLCRSLGISLLLLASVQGLGAQHLSREAYIETYKDLAIRQMEQYKIPASITLAQACLESGDGNSPLARKARNHFGIKCKDWQGKTYYQDDDKPNECFRSYKRVEDSYEDHALFLTQNPRYRSLFAPGLNYQDWAQGLQAAGYATNPRYATLLVSIIESQKLYLLDGQAGLSAPGKKARPVGAVTDAPAPTDSLFLLAQARPVFVCNGRPYILAWEGDTWEALALEWGRFADELQAMNDTRAEAPVPGTRVFLRFKKKKVRGGEGVHVFQEEERLYDLAQYYGLRLSALRKRNRLGAGEEPPPGYRLRLR